MTYKRALQNVAEIVDTYRGKGEYDEVQLLNIEISNLRMQLKRTLEPEVATGLKTCLLCQNPFVAEAHNILKGLRGTRNAWMCDPCLNLKPDMVYFADDRGSTSDALTR